MTGFALASVAGVPFGLFLGTNSAGSPVPCRWRRRSLPLLVLAPLALPRLDAHVSAKHAHPVRSLVTTFSNANHLNAFALIIVLMIAGFERVSLHERRLLVANLEA